MEEFEVAYRTQVTPILAGHGLDTTTSQPWQGAEGVFSRLFDVGSITEVARVKETLAQDTTWSRMLGELGTEFGPEGALRQIPYRFGLFSAPSGPGKLVEVQVDSQLAGPGRGPWRSHYVIDGLANNEVSAILQDRDGDLWFGTRYGGVSRYDGQEWQTYTVEDGLASNAVLSIAQDGDGNLWFGTGLPYDRNSGSGVSRYDGESFATFTTEHGLAQNQVMAILQDREGHIWFGTGDGVSRYDGQSFATLIAADGLAGKPVGSICQDREGSLWFGTEGGIIRYDGRTWTTVLGRDTLDDSMVWSIHQDRSGCIWFGTGLTDRRGGSGVYQYDPSAGSTQNAWTAFTAADGLASDMVHSVFEDSDGYLWFGGGKELSRYDPSAGPGESAWFDLTEEDGLAHPIVWSVCQDREGHIWLGTLGGVSRHAGPAFNTWSTADGLRGLPMPIFRDSKGNLWLGFWRGGVCRYDGEYFTTFRPSEGGSPEGGSFETALSFLEDRHGNIWFGVSAGGGAVRYDGENWRASTTADGLTHNRVHGVFEDSKGTLWFSTRGGGVSRYDGQTFKTFTTEDGLADNQVQSGISEDRNGHIWFGALGGGVSRYDGERFTTYDAEDGLARGHVWPICVDRAGDPWFGCSKGVSRYDGRSFVTYTTRDVIANAQMITIMQDRRGHVWFGTGGGGITRFDGQIFQSLAVEDGLPSNNIHFLHEDPDGTIWFSSAAGLTRFRPPSPFPPGIAIDAVVAGRRYEDPTQVSVPSGLGITTFEFHGMSFKTRTGAMVCRYRLNGYDTDWRTTNDRRVEYADLPAGSYTFEVQAVDRDLAYSEEPATVRLTVHLPYERIALLAALGIALVLIAWQAVRLVQRNRALHTSNVALASANLEIQEQTQRKSAFLASMAHDLRTPMNAIMGFTNMVLRRIGDSIPERQRDNLSKVIQASDHLLAMINDLMDLSKIEAGRMDVNPEPFDVKALVATCCATVSPLVAEKADVVLNDEVSEDVGQANTDQARLRRMVINLLSNAIKFTDSGTVTVNAASQGDQLVIAVADTGKGIPADEIDTIFDEYRQVKGSDKEGKGTGLGLSITRKFAELLEGSIGVDSEVGVGSTFTLRIPMVYSEGVES
ncbi:MAG: two-component regulator propeller domain-containing protein, partial [Candidatus Latescibacteria bacterium]|jgi:signal transduction histidine kinase/ligand-binding sensor domain-containing protein|nr:two-component regulator propeller domain-containing protein [Candidatus Latescibacterota bacterium]